ncbi:MAG: hypothetical protein ACFFAU_08160 [Candidatus Hodarchaeota archaeon]
MSPQHKLNDTNVIHNVIKSGTLYAQMERGGLNYIKNQRNYLILSAIVPLCSFLVQMVNIAFTITFFINRVRFTNGPRFPGLVFLNIDFITPIVVLLFSLLGLIHFIYLVRWKNNVNRYEEQQQRSIEINQDNGLSEINITLTQLFYDIIENMETIKKIFIGLNIIFIFYLQWFFRFFLFELMRIIYPNSILANILGPIIPWLNIILQFLLVFYLIMNWRHFIRWNRKLNRLKDFEKQIYRELDMEDKLLVIRGSYEDLEELKQILLQQKKKLAVSYVSISDKEEFNKMFDEVIDELNND